MQWNQNLCLPSTSMVGSTSGSGNSWTVGISQGTTSPRRPTPDLKSSTSGIRIRLRRWTWTSSPESVMCWTAHRRTLSNTHLAECAVALRCGAFFVEMFSENPPKFSMDFCTWTWNLSQKNIKRLLLSGVHSNSINANSLFYFEKKLLVEYFSELQK